MQYNSLSLFVLFLLTFSLCTCSKKADIEPINFKNSFGTVPDPIFEKILVDKGIDRDKEINGKMNPSDAEAITELELSGKRINSLEGIEMFKNLKSLFCSGNNLLELDLRNNVILEKLYCSSGNISYARPSGVLSVYSKVKMKKLDIKTLKQAYAGNKRA